MSVVTVQLGQCGNQVGCELFGTVAQEVYSAADDDHAVQTAARFFRASRSEDAVPVARAVMVDMEPKVIQACAAAARAGGLWRYSDQQLLSQQSGSANNWAFGYRHHGPPSEEGLLELVRRECEACDRLSGLLLLQSVAGGTGSGLGTFLTESLRDHFAASHIVNAAVWPHESGEVVVQHYNTVLTMARVLQASDAVVVLSNDHARLACQRLLHLPAPSFSDMNRVIAHGLASALLPVTAQRCLRVDAAAAAAASSSDMPPSSSPASSAPAPPPVSRAGRRGASVRARVPRGSVGAAHARDDVLAGLCRHLAPHPVMKLLDVKFIPQMPARSKEFSSDTWHMLLRHLRQMALTNSAIEEGMPWHMPLYDASGQVCAHVNRALSASLVLRGEGSAGADVSGFQEQALYADWAPQPLQLRTAPHTFAGNPKSATLISNSQAHTRALDGVLSSAQAKFHAGAYLHQYAQHGVEQEEFVQAFASLEQVLLAYSQLGR